MTNTHHPPMITTCNTTYGFDVVTRQSATNLCTEALTPLLRDHVSIVKPDGPTDLPYVAFAAAFDESRQQPAVR